MGVRRVHRREFDLGRVHNRDGAGSDHFENVVVGNERGGVFIEADADRTRVVGERRQQSADPVALSKMLVDDGRSREAKAWRERHHVAARRRPFFTADVCRNCWRYFGNSLT